MFERIFVFNNQNYSPEKYCSVFMMYQSTAEILHFGRYFFNLF